MSDIPWESLFGCRLESILVLVAFVVSVGVQEYLVQQKMYPTLAAVVQVILPFHMVVMLILILNQGQHSYTGMLVWVCALACLGLGLIYATRCVRMDFPTFQWVGRLFSFAYAGAILTFFVYWLNVWLSDRYAGFNMPWYVYVVIYLAAALLLVWVLRKLNLPALRRQRYKDFQCIHCGYSLEGNMLASTCPECGEEIEPQVSRPVSSVQKPEEGNNNGSLAPPI